MQMQIMNSEFLTINQRFFVRILRKIFLLDKYVKIIKIVEFFIYFLL